MYHLGYFQIGNSKLVEVAKHVQRYIHVSLSSWWYVYYICITISYINITHHCITINPSCINPKKVCMKSENSFIPWWFYHVLNGFTGPVRLRPSPCFQRCTDHMGPWHHRIRLWAPCLAVSDNGVYHLAYIINHYYTSIWICNKHLAYIINSSPSLHHNDTIEVCNKSLHSDLKLQPKH